MTIHTHHTAPTEFVEGGGIRFAYRRFGQTGGTPLVFLQHFTGTMDNWDPKLVDGFAAARDVILFDNAGIAPSSGTVPDTVEQMAADATAFIRALGLTVVDLFGFSLGGMVSQVITLDNPDLVRRAVLIGTGPRGGEGMAAFSPSTQELFATEYEDADEMWLPLFFTASDESQAAGRAFLARMTARQDDRDPRTGTDVAVAQLTAVGTWGAPREGSYEYLEKITQPVLVINGHNDVIIPTVNSWLLQQELPDATLIVYPDSNHGAQFQFPDLVIDHVSTFLNN